MKKILIFQPSGYADTCIGDRTGDRILVDVRLPGGAHLPARSALRLRTDLGTHLPRRLHRLALHFTGLSLDIREISMYFLPVSYFRTSDGRFQPHVYSSILMF